MPYDVSFPLTNEVLMYLVCFVSDTGISVVMEFDHIPTKSEIPKWAVRMDIALPIL